MNNTKWVKVHVEHDAKNSIAKWTCLESTYAVVKSFGEEYVKKKIKQKTSAWKYVMQTVIIITTIIIYYLHGTTCSSHFHWLSKNQIKIYRKYI